MNIVMYQLLSTFLLSNAQSLFFYKAILQNCSSLEIAWSYSYLTVFDRKRLYYFISEKM